MANIDRRLFCPRLAHSALRDFSFLCRWRRLTANYALQEQKSPFNEPELTASYVELIRKRQRLKARGSSSIPQRRRHDYKARQYFVAHRKRGSNPYIEDVARSLASGNLKSLFGRNALFVRRLSWER